MGLYNFQERFVPFILAGKKTHTIRAIRANPDKPGNTLHLYTGLRHKGAKLLMRVPCVQVQEILIYKAMANRRLGCEEYRISIDGVPLDESEIEALARRDGFSDFKDMMAFWNGRLPFTGQIIHWRSPQ